MTAANDTMDDRHIRCAEMTYMGESVSSIAEACGVSDSSVHKWRRREDVRAYMATLREAAQSATRDVIVGGASAAAARIVALVASADERVALAAAQTVLDRSGHVKGERVEVGGVVGTVELTPAEAAARLRRTLGGSDGQ